jgi:predicted transcriptional regulator
MWRKFGPPRSKFGKWLDKHDVSQTEMSEKSGVSITTIGSLARGDAKRPTRLTERKLRKAIKEIDPNVDSSDFWNL